MRLTPALALALGCGKGPDPASCDPEADAELRLGVGLDAFTPLDRADPAPIVAGAQGGYHVELALRARGIDSGELVSGVIEGSVDGGEVATARSWLQFQCDADLGWAEALGVRLIFVDDPEPWRGATLDVLAEITDVTGDRAAASGRVVLAP